METGKAAVRTTLHRIPASVEEQPFPSMLRMQDGRIAELWGVSTLNRA
ncbi:hypothetical protein OG264_38125 [Streptomyces xanthophaeus]|nr:hypothetical protein OG264_38125 [Streptomyces xanthophaeus]WST58210.1 hypothetical protein OG605_00310 [Streptomyces xanthophaeus]